jgi:hypothetical protein
MLFIIINLLALVFFFLKELALVLEKETSPTDWTFVVEIYPPCLLRKN